MNKTSTKVSSIEKYENSTLIELTELLDELTAKQDSEANQKKIAKEISAVRLAIQQRQRLIKARVMEFEQTNDRHLVFFASTNGFVKVAGHSALFFASTIASRLHWRYSLKLDSDRYSVSEDGIISFRSLDRLKLRLAEIDIYPDQKLTDDELYFFTLPKAHSEEQIQKLRDQTQDDIKQIMNIVLPSSPIPTLYDEIMQASKMIYYQYKHLSDDLAKNTVGSQMVLLTYNMADEYHSFAHAKAKDGIEHLVEIIKIARRLRNGIAYASKIQILHHRDARKALEPLTAVERIASKAYLKQKKASRAND